MAIISGEGREARAMVTHRAQDQILGNSESRRRSSAVTFCYLLNAPRLLMKRKKVTLMKYADVK
jgi:hypothetical protein